MPKNAQNLQVLERYKKMMEISWIDNATMMVLDRPGPSIAIISQDGIDAMAKHAETGGSNHTSFWDLLRSLKPAACAALRNPLRTVASAVLPEADARCPWSSQANFCSGLQIFRLAVSMNWDSDGLGLQSFFMQWYAAYFFQKRPSQSTALNTSGHTLKVSVNGNKPRSTQWHWHNSDNSDTTLGNCNAMWPPCDPSMLHVGPSPGSAATPTKISKEVPPKEFGVDNFLTSTALTEFDSKSSASRKILRVKRGQHFLQCTENDTRVQ